MLPGIIPSWVAGVSPGYRIDRSMFFRPHVSSYLQRSVVAGSNRYVGTYSVWVKRLSLTNQYLLEMRWDEANRTAISFESNKFNIHNVIGGALAGRIYYQGSLHDTCAWMHIVVNWNTPISANAVEIYINGVKATASELSSDSTFPQNSPLFGGEPGTVVSNGRYFGATPAQYLHAYKAEEYLIDGYAHPASMFGQFNTVTGAWEPKAYTGLFGAAGCYWKYTDSVETAAGMGKDYSGMSNLLPWSDAFATNWTKLNNAVVTAGQNDPFGGTSACSLAVGSSTARPKVSYSITRAVNETTTVAVIAAAGTITSVNIFNGSVNGGMATIDLSVVGGAVTSVANLGTGTNTTAKVERVGAWVKCSVTTTHNTAGADAVIFEANSNTTINSLYISLFRANLSVGTTIPNELQKTSGTAVPDKNLTPYNGLYGGSYDTPTNYTDVNGRAHGNYCIFNYLDNHPNVVLYDGNLYLANGSPYWGASRGTIWVTEGKWYWEVSIHYLGDVMVGVMGWHTYLAGRSETEYIYVGQTADGWGYHPSGNKYNGVTGGVGYGSAFALNHILGVALDMDAGTITFYNQGVSQGVAFSNLKSQSDRYAPAISCSTNGQCSANFGQKGPFVYPVPAGHKTLCTENLRDPVIKKPSQYFDTKLRTGTGAPGSLTTLDFQPDMLWSKTLNVASDFRLFDSVRGTDKVAYLPAGVAEDVSDYQDMDFLPNGYDFNGHVGINGAGTTFVDWAWKKGALPGVDIVTYNKANAVNEAIPHSLGAVPAMLIQRERGASNSHTWHKCMGGTEIVAINMDIARQTSATIFYQAPTATHFFIGTAFGAGPQVTWLFSEVPGFSHFWYFAGSGIADGPFVWCGFRPRFLLLKDISAVWNWWLIDTARSSVNGTTKVSILHTNLTNPAYTDGAQDIHIDILSNGFKIRNTSSMNSAGHAIIYAAFAEHPFKYARAR